MVLHNLPQCASSGRQPVVSTPQIREHNVLPLSDFSSSKTKYRSATNQSRWLRNERGGWWQNLNASGFIR